MTEESRRHASWLAMDRPHGTSVGTRLERIERKLDLLLARKAVDERQTADLDMEVSYPMPPQIPERLLVPYGAWQTNVLRRLENLELMDLSPNETFTERLKRSVWLGNRLDHLERVVSDLVRWKEDD